jgi:hypothetical protein
MNDRRWALALFALAIGCGGDQRGAVDENAASDDAADAGAVEERVMIVPATFSGGHEIGKHDFGRPVVLMAAALGVTPEQFREAFSGVRPARGRGPTGEEQRKNKEALMRVLAPLGVTNERMDEVANYYRFRPEDGELWPTEDAEAYAEVKDGKIARVVVTAPGSGYSSPPAAQVEGFETAKLYVRLKFSTELEENRGVAAVDVVE